MTIEKPVIGRVRSAGKARSSNHVVGKVVTVPMDSDIEIGDYVAFKRIDAELLNTLIGA